MTTPATPPREAPYPSKKLVTMFLVLLKIGAFTFGGGWSVIAQMEQEFIKKRQYITDEKLLDIITVGRSLPGIMIINIAVLFGHHVGGVLGGVLAAFAIAIPSIITLCVVALFYASVRDNVYVQKMLTGVRAAVVPIIVSAALKLRKGAIVDRITLVIAVVGCVLCLSGRINNLLLVVLGGIAGLVIQGRRAAK